MKLIIISALAATLATGAYAGKSDRYNDIRFDSAVGHVDASRTDANTTIVKKPDTGTTTSTRNTKRKNTPNSYAYANPYGVGPHNDSR